MVVDGGVRLQGVVAGDVEGSSAFGFVRLPSSATEHTSSISGLQQPPSPLEDGVVTSEEEP